MKTQKVEPCEFVAGLCSNCGASERGACEGWIAPDDRVQSLGEQIDALTKERDEYQQAADTMAMAHKVERDALAAANKDLQDWFDAIKTDHDKLAAAAKLALDALRDSSVARDKFRAGIGLLEKAGVQ